MLQLRSLRAFWPIMSRLSDCLALTLDALNLPAVELERLAELPLATLAHIKKGSHPRPDRFDRILAAIPSLQHRVNLAIAYVLDDSPAQLSEALEDILRGHLSAWLTEHGHTDTAQPQTLREQAAAYGARLSQSARARKVLADMLTRVEGGDLLLTEWLADTGELFARAPSE
jgi:hypothetical protein